MKSIKEKIEKHKYVLKNDKVRILKFKKLLLHYYKNIYNVRDELYVSNLSNPQVEYSYKGKNGKMYFILKKDYLDGKIAGEIRTATNIIEKTKELLNMVIEQTEIIKLKIIELEKNK